MAENAVITLWQRLGSIRHMCFTAEPGLSSKTQWRGSGQGQVDVTTHRRHCEFDESGYFLADRSHQRLPFTNKYRWQLKSNYCLRLAHGRFGPEKPVVLVDFVVADGTGMTCSRPHFCGNDVYSAAITLTDTGFDLRWIITGPRKNEALFYRYDV